MRFNATALYITCVVTALGTVVICDCFSWRQAAYAFGFGLVQASAAYLGATSARRAR